MKYLALILALAALTGAAPAGAQKAKRAEAGSFRFVSGPKGEWPHVPGLNAVLLLTVEQLEKLALAREETLGSEAVVAAGRKVKTDPNATEADREAARKATAEAQGQYDRRVGEILTPAQKELVLRLQVLYGQAVEAAGAGYQAKLVAAKGNKEETARLRQEMQDARSADFIRRVREILTLEQLKAFERAADEEKRRGEK